MFRRLYADAGSNRHQTLLHSRRDMLAIGFLVNIRSLQPPEQSRWSEARVLLMHLPISMLETIQIWFVSDNAFVDKI